MSRVAAFFDLDGTILDRNTSMSYMRFLRKKGKGSLRQTARVLNWVVQYKLAVVDFGAVVRCIVGSVRGMPERETVEMVREWWETEVVHYLRPVASVVIEKHRSQGDTLAILTGGMHYLAELIARHLDVPNVLATRLAVRDGLFTGEPIDPVCHGEGKVIRAKQFAKDHDIDLERSTFYSDSFTDLPMLLRVGNPRPVNPDIRLRRYARRKGWTVEQW